MALFGLYWAVVTGARNEAEEVAERESIIYLSNTEKNWRDSIAKTLGDLQSKLNEKQEDLGKLTTLIDQTVKMANAAMKGVEEEIGVLRGRLNDLSNILPDVNENDQMRLAGLIKALQMSPHAEKVAENLHKLHRTVLGRFDKSAIQLPATPVASVRNFTNGYAITRRGPGAFNVVF